MIPTQNKSLAQYNIENFKRSDITLYLKECREKVLNNPLILDRFNPKFTGEGHI